MAAVGAGILGLIAVTFWSSLTYLAISHNRWPFAFSAPRRFEDLFERYRDSGIVVHGGDLYAWHPMLNNTNPPVVALAYLPLRAMGHSGGAFVMTLISLICVAAIGAIGINRVTTYGANRAWVFSAVAFVPAALIASAPLRTVLMEGQIRTVLVLAVLADLTIVPKRFRGVLTGIAGAISLTPLIFLVIMWFLVDRRAVLRGLSTAVAVTLIGFASGFKASLHYWFVLLPSGEQASRMVTSNGVPHFDGTYNTSLIALQTRLAAGGGVPFPRWLMVTGILASVPILLWLVKRLISADLLLCATLALAIWSLLAAPASWEHYWVWALLTPFAAIEAWSKSRTISMVSGVVGITCVIPSYRAVSPSGSKIVHDGVLLVGHNLYCLVGTAFLVIAAVAARSLPRTEGLRESPVEGTPAR